MLAVAVVAAFTGKPLGGIVWVALLSGICFWTGHTMQRNRSQADGSGP
jgi:hypothetical protein